MNPVARYIKNQFVSLDMNLNSVTGGSPYETISERAYRKKWNKTVWLIDKVFSWFGEKEHCKNAAEGDEAQYELF